MAAIPSTFGREPQNDLLGGDAEVDRIHIGGTSAAVWRLGENAFYKCEELELEANTIRFVGEKALEVPVLEVNLPHNKASHETNLALPQRTRIACDIARFYVLLAANALPRFETVTRCGVYESRLMKSAHPSHPTWLPRILGPFSLEAIRAYMANISTKPPPDIKPPFRFYHADLGPTNIMISEDGNLITRRESAAYYPQFLVATKPVYAGVFWLECETDA
ncbi:Uncharacterized protein TPAR_06804, partial [Tolypocladium paradoxum]